MWLPGKFQHWIGGGACTPTLTHFLQEKCLSVAQVLMWTMHKVSLSAGCFTKALAEERPDRQALALVHHTYGHLLVRL